MTAADGTRLDPRLTVLFDAGATWATEPTDRRGYGDALRDAVEWATTLGDRDRGRELAEIAERLDAHASDIETEGYEEDARLVRGYRDRLRVLAAPAETEAGNVAANEDDDAERPMTPTEKALHDAYYDGAGMSERSHDSAAQQRGFHSSGELYAWVDARLATPTGPKNEVDARDKDLFEIADAVQEALNDADDRHAADAAMTLRGLPGRLRALAQSTAVEPDAGRNDTRGLSA